MVGALTCQVDHAGIIGFFDQASAINWLLGTVEIFSHVFIGNVAVTKYAGDSMYTRKIHITAELQFHFQSPFIYIRKRVASSDLVTSFRPLPNGSSFWFPIHQTAKHP